MNLQLVKSAKVLPFIRDYSPLTDVELIVACQNRQPMAFESLRTKYMSMVCSIIYKLAPERKDIDDLTQDVFVRVWNSISSLREPRAFRSWLNRIVRNCFYDELRRRPDVSLVYLDCALQTESGSDDVFTQIADKAAQPDQAAEYLELTGEIETGLAKLPEKSRRLILLRAEGMSYVDIATLTKTELGTVKSRLARARTKLKSKVLRVQFSSSPSEISLEPFLVKRIH